MSRKIIGVTVGTPLPKPNLMQTDPTKGDYVKGKEEFLKQVNAGAGMPDEKEQLELLIEADMLPAVTDSNGAILTDENGSIILRY